MRATTTTGTTYKVDQTGTEYKTLEPVRIVIGAGAAVLQDYLTPKQARSLAARLIAHAALAEPNDAGTVRLAEDLEYVNQDAEDGLTEAESRLVASGKLEKVRVHQLAAMFDSVFSDPPRISLDEATGQGRC